MLKVAVTGGIGSGKSIVCLIFEKLGIPVFYADTEAKKLMDGNIEIKNKLINSFGLEIFNDNFQLNRTKFATIIFNNKKALSIVNEIVHPFVRKEFIKWTEQQISSYVIQEAAILFESGQEINFDKIITVKAPVEMRIMRVMNRDNTSLEKVTERINNQIDDEEKCKKSNYVIVNDGKEMLLPQVLNIHNKLQLQWQNLESGLALD